MCWHLFFKGNFRYTNDRTRQWLLADRWNGEKGGMLNTADVVTPKFRATSASVITKSSIRIRAACARANETLRLRPP